MPEGVILALGGGGARGLAHLGVLQVLAGHNVPVAGIVGTSMGAAVAAVYGAGADLRRLCSFATVFPWSGLFEFKLPRLGLVDDDRILGALTLLTKGKTLDRLSPPVWVVATDLDTGEAVVLKDGSAAMAVRASISIPGLFAPYYLDGRCLVDGGVAAGVPVEIARAMGQPVVAVDVGFDFETRRVKHFLDVLAKVINIMGSQLDRHQTMLADLVIRPAVGRISSAKFDLAEECIAAGARAAEEALPDLWELLQRAHQAR